jgi:SAM-dependent methyltransferase
MTEWTFWGDRQLVSVYGNIYLRTFVDDWFKIVDTLAKQIKGNEILDLGCGEGHTTKQVLDRLTREYSCDLVEPDEKALNSAKAFLSFENNVGDLFVNTLGSFKPLKKYDSVFTSHTNYYWANEEKEFCSQLDKAISLVKKGGRLLILTLPEKSDHYNIMIRQVYPKFNYAEYLSNYYSSKGFKVKLINFKMRMYVKDIITNKGTYELKNFFRFIHNTDSLPSEKEEKLFLENIKKFQKKGYLDFKDQLILVDK